MIRDPEKNLFRIPDPGVKTAPYVNTTYPLANETVDENGMTHSLLRLPTCMKSIETNQLGYAKGQRKVREYR